jgi:anti-sigma B factor antagonist
MPDLPLTEQRFGDVSVVELTTASLMEPNVLESIRERLVHLVDTEDRRKMILDFSKVDYISSQMIGVLLAVNQRCEGVSGGKLVLCGVGERLEQLLKIMKLHKVLAIKPDQKVAMKFLTGR